MQVALGAHPASCYGYCGHFSQR